MRSVQLPFSHGFGLYTSTMALYVGAANLLLPRYTPEAFATTIAEGRATLIWGAPAHLVAALKAEEGKDIWLFGGGVLFRSLLSAGLVDRVEVGIIPVLLGSGIPLLPGADMLTKLELHSEETFTSGIVLLKYDVVREG